MATQLLRSAAVACTFLAVGSGLAETAEAQDFSRSPIYGSQSLSAGFPGDPRTVNLTAGGPVNVGSTIGGACTGHIAHAPDYRVSYSAGGLPLSFYVTSQADTALVVNAPDGRWYCNDDARGLDPAVHFGQPMSGQYDVWVATYLPETASATLHITELQVFGGDNIGRGAGGGAFSNNNQSSGQQPNPALAPAYGSTHLSAGFTNDPRRQGLTAGGTIDAGRFNSSAGCAGHVAAAPDFRVNYSAGSLPFSFYVTSNADTTLMINAPDGRWYCNDDFRGLDPAVQFQNPLSGQYDVWVGTFGNNTASATLYMSEFSPFSNY